MKCSHIGVINQEFGYDIYTRFDYETATPPDCARESAERMYYREGNGPGTRFCEHFTVVAVPYIEGSSYIVISCVRHDV